jgi:hypothetical protein
MKAIASGAIAGWKRFASAVLMLALSFVPVPGLAAFSDKELQKSIVPVQALPGNAPARYGSGFVVQSDRFSGYVVTNAEVVREAESIIITVPTSGAQLIAQVLRQDPKSDYALLKVNGLELPVLKFALAEPASGEVVWAAARQGPDQQFSLNKGLLRSGLKLSRDEAGWYQHTASAGSGVLLNECGEVLGLNLSAPTGDGSARSLDQATLKNLLQSQNVKLTDAAAGCVSEVAKAREKAELASAEAQRAKDQAEKAQVVARQLEQQLRDSKRSSDDLVTQTRIARERADAAMQAAELAETKAENTRRELEEITSKLQAENQTLLKAFEEDRQKAEERFQGLLASQEEAAAARENLLIGVGIVLIIVLAIVIIMLVRTWPVSGARRSARGDDKSGMTQVHREELSEYVLDGRDDDGIRYLLRISGDQLVNSDGVVIGRNPKDSPYIINHADVSRKHARMKVMKNRVFIEDLGSTNGTSVNGQSIDDKGLVSVSNGDQIIIGSVVMKLRVMDG